MHLEPFFLPGLGCLSYLVGDPATREAAVVDPQIAFDEYRQAADRAGLRIVHVLDTHLHADHLSGARALARAEGAALHLPAAARARYPHEPMADGAEIALGEVRLRARATPGHTPEHLALEVVDLSRGTEQPYAVLTGDALFVGGVGRPDLVGEADPRELAAMLHGSVRRLLSLPAGTLVHPGHGPGSACGAGMADALVSSLGYERETNATLAIGDREAFVEAVLSDLPPKPGNAANLKRINREGPPDGPPPIPAALGLADLEGAAEGALVVDARPAEAFAAGHAPGAVNVVPGETFATRAAPLLEWNRPVLLFLPEGQDPSEAVTALARVGGLHLRGRTDPAAWGAAGLPVERLRTWGPEEAERALRRGEARLLDVRSAGEWRSGHAPGARWVPWETVVRDPPALDREAEWIVMCGSGARSSLAASVLRRAGFPQVGNLRGGMRAWRRAGLPRAA